MTTVALRRNMTLRCNVPDERRKPRTNRFVRVGGILGALVGNVLYGQAPGVVSGVISQPQGPKINGATVTLHPVSLAGAQSSSLTAVVTDKKGAYSIAGAAAGTYQMCIFSPVREVL